MFDFLTALMAGWMTARDAAAPDALPQRREAASAAAFPGAVGALKARR